MAFLTPYSRPQLFQTAVTEYANDALIPADTSQGSTLWAIFNAEAFAAMLPQQQILYLASIIRLSTIGPNPTNSALPNPDVDSFVNAFGVYRIAAAAATGEVTVSVPFAPSAPILIPAVPPGSTSGVIVQTTTGTQFVVIIDTTNTEYNVAQQGYIIAARSTSVTCTVQCLSTGSQGNVAANQITGIYGGPGATNIVSNATASNASAFTNASALESDAALKARLTTAMTASSYATGTAIAAAILGVSLNLTYSIGDNLSSSGTSAPGYVTVVVNNAGVNSSPSTTLIAQVLAAVQKTRTLGITASVIAPTLITVSMTCNARVAAGYNLSAVAAACQTAYATLANNIGLDPAGATAYAKIAAVYATLYAVPGVIDITNLQLNSGTVDVVGTFGQQLVAGSASVSPYS